MHSSISQLLHYLPHYDGEDIGLRLIGNHHFESWRDYLSIDEITENTHYLLSGLDMDKLNYKSKMRQNNELYSGAEELLVLMNNMRV